MQAQWNAHDMKETYGIVISNGTNTFLALPQRKASVSHDWPEEQGIEIDLDQPTFEPREFTLNCALIATSRDDFFAKYDGFFTEISTMGIHELYINDLDKTFLVYYKSQQNCTKLSKIINTTKVGIKFDLVLGETNPADNIPAVYLVDDEDNFLIA